MSEYQIFPKVAVSEKEYGDMSLINYAAKRIGGLNENRWLKKIYHFFSYFAFYLRNMRNRLRFLQASGIDARKSFWPTLKGKDRVLIIRSWQKWIYQGKGFFAKSLTKCDAVITNAVGLPIVFAVADCLVAVLFDPAKQVMAVIHAGREGTVRNIVGKTVRLMEKNFGCDPGDILAHFSPCICGRCYRLSYLGFDVSSREVLKIRKAIRRLEDGFSLDVLKASKLQLRRKNVFKFINSRTECTLCSGRYFSHYGWIHQKRGQETPQRFAVAAVMKRI